jgi:ABC-type polysaccharide/polyol phosphate transport system ATPase subunit
MDSLVAENLGKCYILQGSGVKRQTSTFRERLQPWKHADGEQSETREFWALRDLSFRLQPGSILGIIGANGAGKTTLLKILARVITPTTGRVVGVGRVVSLLELGAGFDPDLPADENILMNAAMFGIPKHEALRRMPEIFEFAGVERFEGTPLKHYSSGMYLRLAFSVAINMNPQILLADEILAVGDQLFQDKCLQRISEDAANGLTVLFVSHDMEAIVRLCNRVMWIHAGQVMKIGEPELIVDEYQNAIWSQADASRSEKGRRANRFAEILAIRLVSDTGRDIGGAPISEDVSVKVRLHVLKAHINVRCALDVNTRGQLLFRSADPQAHRFDEEGIYDIFAKIPANLLAESTYSVTVNCSLMYHDEPREFLLVAYNALSFIAFSTEDTTVPVSGGRLQKLGLIAPKLEWTVKAEKVDAARA